MEKTINIFIGGSTNNNISQIYHDIAIELGQKINERKDYHIIFDGCFGLPYLSFKELDCTDRSTILVTDYYSNDYMYDTSASIVTYRTQSEFINHISKISDAMIFMKGGLSTVAEIIYSLDAKKNCEHDKPIVIINANNEWDELINLLQSFKLNNIYYVTDNVIDALNYIEIELFKDNSHFRLNYLQYFSRKEPIIENNESKYRK